MDAYRQLDRGRKKLKKVRSLVYHDATSTEEDNDVYRGAGENHSDADWFKLRDVRNGITFNR